MDINKSEKIPACLDLSKHYSLTMLYIPKSGSFSVTAQQKENYPLLMSNIYRQKRFLIQFVNSIKSTKGNKETTWVKWASWHSPKLISWMAGKQKHIWSKFLRCQLCICTIQIVFRISEMHVSFSRSKSLYFFYQSFRDQRWRTRQLWPDGKNRYFSSHFSFLFLKVDFIGSF